MSFSLIQLKLYSLYVIHGLILLQFSHLLCLTVIKLIVSIFQYSEIMDVFIEREVRVASLSYFLFSFSLLLLFY
jgi:hypothetical protein